MAYTRLCHSNGMGDEIVEKILQNEDEMDMKLKQKKKIELFSSQNYQIHSF